MKDPHHFYDAFFDRAELSGVTQTPEGDVATYTWRSPLLLGFHISGVMTREEYVPHERIVDHSSTGPVWTFSFEPDPTGTTLTLAFEWSSRVPLADKVVDRVSWNGDRDVDAILANLKTAIET